MADWHAIVLEGPYIGLRAFTAGFLAGRGEVREAVLHRPDAGLEPGSFGERLRALLHGGRHEVLLVDARLGAVLASALADHAGDLGIRVVDRAVIASAWFTFRAQTPSREAASRIKGALHDVPAGVALTDHEREEVDPDAGAVELYAPAHAYTFRASGRITGPSRAYSGCSAGCAGSISSPWKVFNSSTGSPVPVASAAPTNLASSVPVE